VSRRAARKRVVVLGGAGAMGRIILRDLLRTAKRELEPVLADRDPSVARQLGVEGVRVDVTRPTSLRRALSGAFATIASLPYRFNLDAMKGALAAGSHHVDLGGLFHVTRQQLELAAAFREAGLMSILGVGSAPGILNVLAVRAAEGLDEVREIHCLVGARDLRPSGGDGHGPLAFPYSPETLLDEFAKPSAVFRDGRFREVPPLDPRERVRVRFPRPVGELSVDTTLHSEVATLPLSFRNRGVREVTFRQGFEDGFADALRLLVDLGLARTDPLPDLEVSPRQVLLALVGTPTNGASTKDPPPAARHEVLRVIVRGRAGRSSREVIADCHAGPDAGWGTGPDIDTGGPPSIAVQLLASGELPLRPGVWAPEQVIPVRPFLRELERRDMRVRVRRTPQEVRS
jgi:saccharopine dehydrogenase-like NADP-dependent oxidoreductase